MARDRANLRTDIWGDLDWRSLSFGAQWLYQYLLTSPSLSYVGVADWYPKRISKLAQGLAPEAISTFAAELIQGRFIVIDEETDEVFVRSFLRHDGLLVNPNLWKSIGLAFPEVSSPTLIASVAYEMQRLRDESPEGYETAKGGRVNPWESKHLRTPLQTPSDTQSHTPIDTPSERGSDTGYPTTTATSTTTEASLLSPGEDKVKETRLPKDWAPTASHLNLARELRVDVLAEAESFRLHAETHDRHAARWNSAFTTWLKKAKPAQQRRDPDAWMNT